MNEGVFSINSENSHIELSEKQKYKICSLSGLEALNKQLMWGHYAATGMGVAIEVEVDEHHAVEEVIYDESFENLNTVKGVLTHKSEDWEYENEFRYLSNSLTDSTVKLGTITAIHFGTPYEGLSNYDDIKKKHENLKTYTCLRSNLRNYCEDKGISCKNYNFIDRGKGVSP